MENVNPESTISTEEQATNQPATEQTEEQTAPQTVQPQAMGAEQQSEEVESSSAEPFLSVQFNHKSREMTREQAIEFAQKGLLYDKLTPIYNQLDYLAAQSNTTVSEYVKQLLKRAEDGHRQSLAEKFGDDEQIIEELMEFYRSRNADKYQKVLADRKKAEQEALENAKTEARISLTEQFKRLRKEFPEITDISQLPKEAAELAANEKMELTAAYLLHRHREDRRIAEAAKRAAEQSKSSTGSAQSNEISGDIAMDAFIRGVRK